MKIFFMSNVECNSVVWSQSLPRHFHHTSAKNRRMQNWMFRSCAWLHSFQSSFWLKRIQSLMR